jgi:hypothetical protein
VAKKTRDPAKAKAAKQKKIVIAGSVALILLMVIEVPMIMKHGQAQTAVANAAASTTAAAATPPPATPVAPGTAVPLAAPDLSGSNPTAAPVAAPAGTLVADPLPTPGQGQLAEFNRFASKDPFADQSAAATAGTSGTAAAPASGTAAAPASPTAPQSGSSGSTGSSSAPAAPVAPPSSAVIAVNGQLESVAADATFPAAQPVFHLKSVTAHSAKIEVAGGTYASGAASITLQEKKPVTLMNTADGTRYTIELFPQNTPIPAATAGGASTGAAVAAPAPATTTPTSTPGGISTVPASGSGG